MCVCVAGDLVHVFNTFISSTKAFITSAERVCPLGQVFIFSTINAFIFFFGRLFWIPPEKAETREIMKTSFQLGMGLRKYRTRKRWKNVRRLPYICFVFLQMLGSLLALFHFCLVSVLFSGPSLTEMNFCRTFFLSSMLKQTDLSLCKYVGFTFLNQIFLLGRLKSATFGPYGVTVVCHKGCLWAIQFRTRLLWHRRDVFSIGIFVGCTRQY